MRTRRIASIAAIGAVAVALAACSGGNGGSTAASSPAAGGEGESSAPAQAGQCTPAELDKLSIMAPFFSPTAPGSDDAVGKELGELAGAELDMRWVPNSSYGDQTNVVLAGDDIPNIMVIQGKTQGFVQTAEAGGFWDLGPYLASGEFPNLITSNPEVQQAASVNGTVYGIYRSRDVIRHGVIIRKDWLENLGLEAPTTLEELKEVARAFTEDDPDGNGANDTYGMIVPKWPGTIGTNSPWDAIDVWYGVGNMWNLEDDGTFTSIVDNPDWRESLKFQRDFIESGYVNPDWVTMDPQQWNEQFINGKGGIIIDVQSRAGELLKLYAENDPETAGDYVLLTAQPEGPNGKHSLPTTGYNGFLAVPKASVKTEDELCAVLGALDALNSKEAQILMNNGIEGVNFTVEDGLSVANSDEPTTALVTGAWAQLGMNVGEYQAYRAKQPTPAQAELEAYRLELQAQDLPDAVFNPAAAYVSPTYVTNGTQLDTLLGDARIQYLAGQLDDAGLDAVIERWKSSGGDQIAAELAELHAKGGSAN